MTARAAKAPKNPYLAARLEWNERYGSYIARERAWRFAFFIALLAAVAAIGVAGWLSAQSRVVPYVIEVDALGRTQQAGPLAAETPLPPQVVRRAVMDFIEETRTVSSDAILQRRLIDRAFARMARSDPAFTAIAAFFRETRPPFETAERETIAVELASLTQTAPRVWAAEWTETARDRQGAVIRTERFKGSLALRLAQPRTEAEIARNPLGVYIREFYWSRELEN